MVTALAILGALAAVALSAFSSGTETGTYCLNRVRLRVRSERNVASARTLAELMRRPQDLVIAALLGTNVADYLLTVCVTLLLLRAAVSESRAEIYATAIATPIILVFGGILPKDWFRRESDRLMYAAALPLAVLRQIAAWSGALWLLRSLGHALVRWIDPDRATHEETLLTRAHTVQLLREGAARGGLSTFQRDTIERVLNLSKVRVGSVMIQRARAATLPIDTPRDDFLRVARMAHFSRLPVWRGDPKRVVGVVNVYDVLTDEDRKPIAAHVRPRLLLRSADTVPVALLKLQEARQAMAIVEDRFGNCIGLLTIKDLVEEIVGELAVW